MPAEKKDRHTGADTASADYLGIFFPQRCSPDRQAPQDQLSAPSQAQNLATQLRVYSQERTFEFAIRSACCFSSPVQELASRSRATSGALAAAALLSTSGDCKARGLIDNEPLVLS